MAGNLTFMQVIPTLHSVDEPTSDELAAMLGVNPSQLGSLFISTGELMTLWGVARQTLDEYQRRWEDFPVPVLVLPGRKIWLVGDIRSVAVAHGRKLPGSNTADGNT